jgi:hypothetical protein
MEKTASEKRQAAVKTIALCQPWNSIIRGFLFVSNVAYRSV